MVLTKHQQDMLDGKYGKGKAMAMQIQTAVGEGFSARRMVPAARVHVALSAQEADTWFARRLRDAGAVCAVAPTVNPGYCLEYFKGLGFVDEASSALMKETEEVYRDLGAILSYSCTPYLFGNIPRYAEVVSFSETSASVYANSVLGARTHRESSGSALCAAITGYVPEYGVLLEENRSGTVLVEVQAHMETDFELTLLGLTAKKIGGGIPVFKGISKNVTTEGLIALGAQLNVAGACDMFHIPGLTPEAADLRQALGGRAPDRTVIITEQDLERAREEYLPMPKSKPEFVMLGCPHYTYRQIRRVTELLEGRTTAADIWILTSAADKDLAARTGLETRLKSCGGRLLADTCVDQAACWGHLAGKFGATDSPKCAYYMQTFGVELAVQDVDTCIRWALEGRIC